MSRAFVKEDNAGEPPIIPQRPALPPGATNYITPQGLTQLKEELALLEAERAQTEANHEDEANRTRQLTILNAQLSALTQRLASARVIDPQTQPSDEVRFGATVELQTISGGKKNMKRLLTIVGVDEASIMENKIAFVAPLARAVIGAKVGQTVLLQMGKVAETVKVASVTYKR
ncbi:GreA/GreB family elongation factor [Pontibacter akesuensis]|uniref:Transcription elongation factor GreB n=1 Tax=Pontibacter akesuensis TaxID=388950 RepID=A0A1I7FWX8_9BACT|nr:GreA/GreB family elongation factor [Pontibacter akesuensis]GHA60100.1 transcription elongation factor GreB [Pontibacter akesuensis]SFU40695.1 transcription elongation factor GreB [Pontibacter akesuensis]